MASPFVLDYTPTHEKPTAVYRLFDADDILLYVGISTTPKIRWANHAADKPWWPQVARKTVEWFESREPALDAERDAIQAERPLFNVVNHPVNWPAALERYKAKAQATWERKRRARRLLGVVGTPTREQQRQIEEFAALLRHEEEKSP